MSEDNRQQSHVVIVNQAPPSQALPALANVFVPGLGQLIQGRVGAAIIFVVAAVVAAVSIAFLVGIVLYPAVILIAILDAAKFNPMATKPEKKKRSWLPLLALILLFIVLSIIMMAITASNAPAPG